MTQEFKTIGQCIDWLDTEEGKDDSFEIYNFKGLDKYRLWKCQNGDGCMTISTNYVSLGEFLCEKHLTITHIPHEKPYEWDYLQALKALESGEVKAVECDIDFNVTESNGFLGSKKSYLTIINHYTDNDLRNYLDKNKYYPIGAFGFRGKISHNLIGVPELHNVMKAKFRPYTPKENV